MKQTPKSESDLYPVIEEVLCAIINDFGLRKTRRVVGTHRNIISHKKSLKLKSSPDFMIQAKQGFYFGQEEFPVKPTYAQCASPIEVKTEAKNTRVLQENAK